MKNNEMMDELLRAAKQKIEEKALEAGSDIIKSIKDATFEYFNGRLSQSQSDKISKKVEIKENPEGNGGKIETQTNTHSGRAADLSENMSEEDEERFLENLPSRFGQVALKGISTPIEAMAALHTIILAGSDVIKFCEIQETKRTGIELQMQQALKRIDAQKIILMTYLEKTFDERKLLFAQYFRIVDDALAKNNMQSLAIGLKSITDLAASSPFKNLEDISHALQNPNTIWKL